MFRHLILFMIYSSCLFAQVAQRPPMGWNSWNVYRLGVDDAAVRANALSLVTTGLQRAGYRYVVIDGGWEGVRDAQGNFQTNSRFPDMAGLAAYVHSLGLQIGIHGTPGPTTCNGAVGSYGHEYQDAQTFASWGMDFLKYDWCSAGKVYTPAQQPYAYQLMSDALAATERPFVYSICQYGKNNVWLWAASVGANMWRTTGDLHDNWDAMSSIGFDQQIGLAPYAGPGHWNDPDMLQVGNGGMTDTEYRTHFSLWAILAAPLIAGNNLTTMTTSTLAILGNREVIAVDQDVLGQEGQRIWQAGKSEIWSKPLTGGAMAVGFFNRGDGTATIPVTWSQLGFSGTPSVRNLWAHKDLGRISAGYNAVVPSHGVVLLRLNP
jgi:alpha-galactosidase